MITLDNIIVRADGQLGVGFVTFMSDDHCILSMDGDGVHCNAHITRAHARAIATRILECLDRADAMDAERGRDRKEAA